MSRFARGTAGFTMALAVLVLARPLRAADEVAPMPDVVGAKVNDAMTALRSVGLSAAVVEVAGTPEGTVGGQQPAKGVSLATWMPAVLEVRRRMEGDAPAPQAVDLAFSAAVTTLAPLYDLRLEPVSGADAALGTIVAQSPTAGAPLPPRGTITLSFVPDYRLPAATSVPDVRGLAPAEALDALAKAGFQGRISALVAPGAARGVVLHQAPLGGTTARRYGRVEVVVPTDGPSRPPAPIETTVPDCVGGSESEAIERLSAAGLVPRIETVEGDAAQASLVASQDPAADAPAATGSFVTIRVSRPTPATPLPSEPTGMPTTVPMPNLMGMSLAQATDVAAASGLVADPVMEANPAVAPLRVYAQRNATGVPLALGSRVRFRVASPPRPATAGRVPAPIGLPPGTACVWARVPDLSRLRSDAAATALGDAGFGAARVLETPRTEGDWRVFAQIPAAGSIAPTCQPVTTWIARPMIEGVSVPGVVGQFEVRARVLLERMNGLRPVVEYREDPSGATAPEVVWQQSPPEGRRVAAGSRVVVAVQPRPSDTPPAVPTSPDAPPSPPTPPTSPEAAPASTPPAPTPPANASGTAPPPAAPCAVRVGIVPDVVGQDLERALALLRGPSGDLFRNVVVRREVAAQKPVNTVLRQEPAFTGILVPFTTQVILIVAVP